MLTHVSRGLSAALGVDFTLTITPEGVRLREPA